MKKDVLIFIITEHVLICKSFNYTVTNGHHGFDLSRETILLLETDLSEPIPALLSIDNKTDMVGSIFNRK